VEKKDLPEQIRELNERIAELENQISLLVRPIEDLQSTAKKYFHLLEYVMKHSGASPDMLLPEVKDPISQDIVRVLAENGHLNISQITEGVRSKRGSASRRVVREKITTLAEKDIVIKDSTKKIATYCLSEEVVKKWSQLLGIAI